jgi:ankyrin repeat protein
LLSLGAKTDGIDGEPSPLVCAAINGRKGNRALMESGVNVNQTTPDEVSAMVIAADTASVPILRRLAAVGADVNASDDLRVSALGCATCSDHAAAVCKLNLQGSAVDATDLDGRMPLMEALSWVRPEL